MKTAANKYQGIADAIKTAFGDPVKTERYCSDKVLWTKRVWKNRVCLDIVSLPISPFKGVTVYSTLGLSDHEMRENGKPPFRVELLSALRDDTDFSLLTEDSTDKDDFYEKLLLCLGAYIVNDNMYFPYGDVWVNFFSNKFSIFSDLEHLFFMPPALLTDKLKPVATDGGQIDWLLCVPISEAELQYREKKGPEALQELLMKNKVDVSDLFRKSVV
jgi:hypothetical protein